MLTIEYTLLGKVENELRKHSQWIIDKIEYQEKVRFHVLVPVNDTNIFEEFMINLTNSKCVLKQGTEHFIEVSTL